MRVLLVDDHPLLLQAVEIAIKSLVPKSLVDLTYSAAGARASFKAKKHQLVLVDLSLGDANGLDLVEEFAQEVGTRVIVFSGDDTEATKREAFERGSAGFIPKAANAALFRHGLATVLRGAIYVPPSRASRHVSVPPTLAPKALDSLGLSDKQKRVTELLLTGKRNRAIANDLNISEHTVRHHLTHIYEYMEVQSRAELLAKAARMGLQVEFRME